MWNMKIATVLSGLGIVIGAAYLLWMLQRVFFGVMPERWNKLPDVSLSESIVLVVLAVFVVLYGFQPSLITRHFEPEVSKIAKVYPLIHSKYSELSARVSQVPLKAESEPNQ